MTSGVVAAAKTGAASERNAEALLKRLDWQVVRRLDGILQGDYRSLFKGHGYDLAEVREYQPEDDVRYMDWNVTARMNSAYVRQYIEDREITAWLILDLSPSIDFGTAKSSKRELVVDFVGTMARLLTRHGNRVGAVLFGSGGDEVIAPRGGQMQTLRLLHRLTSLGSGSQLTQGVPDFAATLSRVAGAVKRRSLVIIVSDFFVPPGWEGPLTRLAERHEVLSVWLADPRETELPELGPLVFEDAETREQVYVDTGDHGFQSRFRALVEQRDRRLSRTFAQRGVDLLRLNTDGDMVRDISKFAQLRRDAHRRAAGRAVAR